MTLEERLHAIGCDRLRDLLRDVWIDDDRREDINDLDEFDLVAGVTEWVRDGIERNLWTEEVWIESVLDSGQY